MSRNEYKNFLSAASRDISNVRGENALGWITNVSATETVRRARKVTFFTWRILWRYKYNIDNPVFFLLTSNAYMKHFLNT